MKETELMFAHVVLIAIAAMSTLVAWEFYKSRNGMLRILIIQLFATKVWVYAGASFVFFLYPDQAQPLIARIILNLPMVIVMIRLYTYIKTHRS